MSSSPSPVSLNANTKLTSGPRRTIYGVRRLSPPLLSTFDIPSAVLKEISLHSTGKEKNKKFISSSRLNTIPFDIGTQYVGEWKEGKMDGVGKKIYTNGNVYEGEWKDGKRWGTGQGFVKNNMKTKGGKKGQSLGPNKGTMADDDIDDHDDDIILIYSGQWENDKKHGEGVGHRMDIIMKKNINNNTNTSDTVVTTSTDTTFSLSSPSPSSSSSPFPLVYEGFWRTNFPHGQGEMTFSNQMKYKGEFHMGNMEGEGKMVYPNGDIYSGQWRNNERNGFGKFWSETKQLSYEGMWENNIPMRGEWKRLQEMFNTFVTDNEEDDNDNENGKGEEDRDKNEEKYSADASTSSPSTSSISSISPLPLPRLHVVSVEKLLEKEDDPPVYLPPRQRSSEYHQKIH